MLQVADVEKEEVNVLSAPRHLEQKEAEGAATAKSLSLPATSLYANIRGSIIELINPATNEARVFEAKHGRCQPVSSHRAVGKNEHSEKILALCEVNDHSAVLVTEEGLISKLQVRTLRTSPVETLLATAPLPCVIAV